MRGTEPHAIVRTPIPRAFIIRFRARMLSQDGPTRSLVVLAENEFTRPSDAKKKKLHIRKLSTVLADPTNPRGAPNICVSAVVCSSSFRPRLFGARVVGRRGHSKG
eukprot:7718499-Pyramimonas_sp.AAC.1